MNGTQKKVNHQSVQVIEAFQFILILFVYGCYMIQNSSKRSATWQTTS